MADITKRATFYPAKRRAPKTFHIEVEGAIVNITVGLVDMDGRWVTRVDVTPEDEARGGDGLGNVWHKVDECRIVRDHPKEV